MGIDRRPGRWALKDPRWPVVRIQALRRDGWQCVICGSRRKLEVDHIEAVRNRADIAFDLGNLQTLCSKHHAEKTQAEMGHGQSDPERKKWGDLLHKGLHLV